MTPRARTAQVLSRQSAGRSAAAGRPQDSFALPAAPLPALPAHRRSFRSTVTPPVTLPRPQWGPELSFKSP
jgi:hypothetical protein